MAGEKVGGKGESELTPEQLQETGAKTIEAANSLEEYERQLREQDLNEHQIEAMMERYKEAHTKQPESVSGEMWLSMSSVCAAKWIGMEIRLFLRKRLKI